MFEGVILCYEEVIVCHDGANVMFRFYQVFSGVHVKISFYQVFSGDYVKIRIYQVLI